MPKNSARIALRLDRVTLEALEDLVDIGEVPVSYLVREIIKRSVRARMQKLAKVAKSRGMAG